MHPTGPGDPASARALPTDLPLDLPSALPFLAEPRTAVGNSTRGGDDRVVWVGEPSILPAVSCVHDGIPVVLVINVPAI